MTIFYKFETGRYKKIPSAQRLCPNCDNKLEDEYHFFLHCHLNMNLRTELKSKLNIQSENLTDLNILKTILNPSTPSCIKAVDSFIKQSLELRREG